MRKITDHHVPDHRDPGINEHITVEAVDGPGPGGASHHYRITHPVRTPGVLTFAPVVRTVDLEFQKGGVAEVGVNGLTHEALLAVVADRLRSFQAGPFACHANAQALAHVHEALQCLHARTDDRARRGVEGTQAP